jgi:hypothetical protein
MKLLNEINVSHRLALIRVTLIACSSLAIVTSAIIFSTNILNSFDTQAGENRSVVSGIVYEDINKNGISDEGETPLAGSRILLYNDYNADGIVDPNDNLVKETYANQGGSYSFRLKASSENLEQHVLVSSYTDDANEKKDGSIDLNDNDLHIGYRLAATKFNNIDIPSGAQILDAYITFVSQDTRSGECKTLIYGEASDNALEYAQEDNNISSRSKTTQSISWSPDNWLVNDKNNTPSLSPIVQEIVNRPGWKKGNSIALIFQPELGHRDAMAREEHMNKAPVLHINYVINQRANDLIVKIDQSSLGPKEIVTGNFQYAIKNDNQVSGLGEKNFGIWSENLPVQWEKFKVHKMNDYVELHWQTGLEDAGSHFEVQKSSDLTNWQVFDELIVSIGQEKTSEYASVDFNNEELLTHYRIKRVTKSGQVQYSPVRKIINESQNLIFDVYPIPANDVLTIRPRDKQIIEASLVNMSGKVLQKMKIEDIHTFSIAHLPKGMYFVNVVVGETVQTKKILIQH